MKGKKQRINFIDLFQKRGKQASLGEVCGGAVKIIINYNFRKEAYN